MPPSTTLTGYPKTKLFCFESDYRFGYDWRILYFQIGLGVNFNLVNGGINYDDKKSSTSGVSEYNSYNNDIGIGIGFNLGLGFYLIDQLAVYTEYAAQGIFGKAEMGWGGLKFGIRYLPWRIQE